jgi:hypothetical protein
VRQNFYRIIGYCGRDIYLAFEKDKNLSLRKAILISEVDWKRLISGDYELCHGRML